MSDPSLTEPTISVLMPIYNAEPHLQAALDGLARQRRQPDEVILLDDGSTDASSHIVQDASKRYGWQAGRNETNRGVVYSLNRLLEQARSQWLYFAASDDMIAPDFFSTFLPVLRNRPRAGIAACSVLRENSDETNPAPRLHAVPIRSRPTYLPPRSVRHCLQRYGLFFHGAGVLYNRQYLSLLEGFDSSLGPYCDAMAIQIIAGLHGMVYVPRPLALIRVHSRQFSQSWYRHSENLRRVVDTIPKYMSRYKSLFPQRYVRFVQRSIILQSVFDSTSLARQSGQPLPTLVRSAGLDSLPDRLVLRGLGWDNILTRVMIWQYLKLRLGLLNVPALLSGLERKIRGLWRQRAAEPLARVFENNSDKT